MNIISQRPSSEEDGAFLFHLYASTRTDEVAAWGWPPSQAESFLRMQFRARSQSYAATYPGASTSILVAGEQPIGSIIVWRGLSEIRLVDIALLPEYRKRGLGAAVVSELIREAAATASSLRLSVQRSNRAIRLYERLGFVPIDDGPMDIAMEYRRAAESA